MTKKARNTLRTLQRFHRLGTKLLHLAPSSNRIVAQLLKSGHIAMSSTPDHYILTLKGIRWSRK